MNCDRSPAEPGELIYDPRTVTVLDEFEQAARSFSGPVFILLPDYYRNPKTPQLRVDLAQIGFIPGSLFTVRDDNQQFLYRDSHRYFGTSLRDQHLVAAAPHGSRLFIQHFNGQQTDLALIWICKRRDHPPIAQSLHYKKSAQDALLNRTVVPNWQPRVKARDRAVQLAQLNQPRQLQVAIASCTQSQVRIVAEPIVQGAIAVSQTTPERRSQVSASAQWMNIGAIAAHSTSRSYCSGKGEQWTLGQLQIRSARQNRSKLESYLRVRPRATIDSNSPPIYGSFGNALLKHRRRYGFTYDPDLDC